MDRNRARALARASLLSDRPLGWFEELYLEAEAGKAVVPWADLVPNPHLKSWLDEQPRGAGRRALDVGAGFGDNAELLAEHGWAVTAFDLSPTAVARSVARWPQSKVHYQVGDLLEPDPAWHQAFDLVFEAYTIQVLRGGHRRRAIELLGALVAPGGELLVLARGREPSEPEGEMPWPLTAAELRSIARPEMPLVSLEDFIDDEDPPVRRFRALYRRRGPE